MKLHVVQVTTNEEGKKTSKGREKLQDGVEVKRSKRGGAFRGIPNRPRRSRDFPGLGKLVRRNDYMLQSVFMFLLFKTGEWIDFSVIRIC